MSTSLYKVIDYYDDHLDDPMVTDEKLGELLNLVFFSQDRSKIVEDFTYQCIEEIKRRREMGRNLTPPDGYSESFKKEREMKKISQVELDVIINNYRANFQKVVDNLKLKIEDLQNQLASERRSKVEIDLKEQKRLDRIENVAKTICRWRNGKKTFDTWEDLTPAEKIAYRDQAEYGILVDDKFMNPKEDTFFKASNWPGEPGYYHTPDPTCMKTVYSSKPKLPPEQISYLFVSEVEWNKASREQDGRMIPIITIKE